MSYKKVFIIESESAKDLIDRRTEGEGLQRLLNLCEMRSTLRRIASSSEFRREVEIFQRTGCNVLHLSCHGNTNGIAFTNGDSLLWSDLRSILEPVLSNKILCLSSCAPLGGKEILDLFDASDQQPFIIAGSGEKISWSEAFVMWTLMYSAIGGPHDPSAIRMKRALAAFNLATDRDFQVHFAAKGEAPISWDAVSCRAELAGARNAVGGAA